MILSLIALSGCSFFEEEEVSREQEMISADSVLDGQNYKWAIDTKDVKFCDSIKEAELKVECINVVDSIILTEKAISKLQDDFCDYIEIDGYKESCKNIVASKLDVINENKEIDEQIQEAIDERSEELCMEVEDENQKEACLYTVITNKALESKDKLKCEDLSSDEMRNFCDSLF
mgnify:CR=1 FL=1